MYDPLVNMFFFLDGFPDSRSLPQIISIRKFKYKMDSKKKIQKQFLRNCSDK